MKDGKSKGLIIFLLGLGCLVLAYFGPYAYWKEVNLQRTELKRLELDKQNLDQSLQLMESFLSKYITLGKEAELANQALPVSAQPALLLGEIEQLAKLSGVVVSTVNFSEKPAADIEQLPANSIVTLEAQISSSGSYFSFRDFLDRLERHIRIIDLQMVSIGAEEKNPTYNFEIRFKTYYQK